jgi:hypothetical protein
MSAACEIVLERRPHLRMEWYALRIGRKSPDGRAEGTRWLDPPDGLNCGGEPRWQPVVGSGIE